ncbi:hypothetical protein [Pseudomonas sp. RC10]|uniref:hypothetical protein n=1 Tax=Pseudomonas bambusae TaxID=3139142 RepID=UPI003139E819
MQHPEHLAQFASLFNRRDITRFMSAPWLVSSFDSRVWLYNFKYKKDQTLDWGVRLYDGSLLTDEKNADLLKALRAWLIVSTQNSGSQRHSNSMHAQAADFRRTLTLIDHILQNGEALELCEGGLGSLTYDEMRGILAQVGTSSIVSNSTYDWNRKLKEFCLSLLEQSDAGEIGQALQAHPYLSVITPEQLETNELDIPLALVPQVRAALFVKKLYHSIPTGGYNVNSVKISQQLYSNTLAGSWRLKPMHRILGFIKYEDRFTRELEGVPVTSTNRDRMTKRDLTLYKTCFVALQKLNQTGLILPSAEDLRKLAIYKVTGSQMGRFKNVPTDIIFKAVRDAIELHLEHGADLLQSYVNVAKHALKRQINITSIPHKKLISLLEPAIAELGVSQLGISARSLGKTPTEERKQGKAIYFSRLRDNAGLLELIGVYFGAIQIVVGATMAKRGTELRGLDPKVCLSKDQKWLIAPLAKSSKGRKGLRSTNARPIDPLAAEMISTVISFQQELLNCEYITETLPLFSSPGVFGMSSLTPCDIYLYYKNIDLFCDYFQVGLDSQGRRYYLRQHQLRRFFALVFLNCGYGSSVAVLQWMFGHGDPAHIWNYITEELPGKELRNTLAQALGERMASGGATHFTDIIDLIEGQFGTRNVSVMDAEKLAGYFDFLMETGELELTPEFLQNDTGYQVEILAVLRKKNELE